jgi:hypothetical protein
LTFIDWSDAEGMFGLLVELVADERAECQNDPERLRFVEDLLVQLRTLEAKLPQTPGTAAIQRLKDIHESADPGFMGDTVMVHLKDCIHELERVGNI